MGYYIRILGINDPDIPISVLADALKANKLSAQLGLDDTEHSDKWTVLDVFNTDGEALTQIERNPVIEGELGAEELQEFIDEIQDEQPISAVKWLNKYLKRVKVIYAFQMMNAAFEDDNHDIISTIKTTIWEKTGGIFQADAEGFSNEEGYHILWQFADDVSGEWNCAVRNIWGQWKKFKMELGNEKQRAEFLAGKVPISSVPL